MFLWRMCRLWVSGKNMIYDYNTALENGNTFEDNVLIEPGVIIGKNNHFSRNCTIRSNCKIGDNNYFMVNVTIGSSSRERFQGTHRPKHMTDYPMIEIGNSNVLEDNVLIQAPLESITKISNNTYIGAFTHISHDVVIEDNVILSSHCSIGGYSIIMQQANIGMGTRVHQRSVVGYLSMVGAGCVILGHITPFATVVGVPARYIHVNRTGMIRAGIIDEDIQEIEKAIAARSAKDLSKFYRDIFIVFKQNTEIWQREKDYIPNIII